LDPSAIDAMVSAIGASAGAYGHAVLTTAEDEAASSTVRLGLRLLALLRHRAGNRRQVEEAVLDDASHPGDPDFRAGLRAQVRKALEADPSLAAELATLLEAGGITVAADDRSVAVQRNDGIISTGDNAVNALVRLPKSALRPPAEVECPAGLSNLPRRTALFIGRAGALTQIDSAFEGGVAAQAVLGPGGVGKSALAACWAATRSDCRPAWWITAGTPAAIEAGLAGLAVALEPFLTTALPAEALRDRAIEWLAAHTGWLLVLDDVRDPGDVRDLVAREVAGRFLVTSRRATGWHGIAAPVPLDALTEDEAVALLQSMLPYAGSPDADGAIELCRELGCLPLAVEQAGAWIAQAAITPRAYLGLLARYPAAMRAATPGGWLPGKTGRQA